MKRLEIHPLGSAQGARRTRQARHPLLGVFPLAVMGLAAFLVLFTLVMAKLNARSDPDLLAGKGNSLLAASPSRGAVTTASGRRDVSQAVAKIVGAQEVFVEPKASGAASLSRLSGGRRPADADDY